MITHMIKAKKQEKLLIANATFLIDYEKGELREQRNPANRIAFDSLQHDESGNIPILFDKLTRNIYKGYLPQNGLPPMTEQVVISAQMFIDPSKRQLLDNPATGELLRRQTMNRQLDRTSEMTTLTSGNKPSRHRKRQKL